MILLYPALLVVAVGVARRSPHAGSGVGWFAAWTLAGTLFTLSLAAGFSFGLLLLPLVALILLGTAWRAPRWREAAGFFAGVGVLVGLLVALSA